MAEYKVRLYKQTGYNMTDVPDSKTTLDKNLKEDCAVIMQWQSRVLSHITVAPTITFKIEDCDYARITRTDNADGDMCYFVGQGIIYLAEGTAMLPLIFDSVGTCLINNLLKDSIIGGRVARRHTNEENMIPEPFSPTRPMNKTQKEIDVAETEQYGVTWTPYIPLVISSTSLANLAKQGENLPAEKFTDKDGNGVIVPALVSPTQTTELFIATRDDAVTNPYYHYARRPLPQKMLYRGEVYTTNDSDYSKNGNNIAQLLRGLGLDSIISSAYSFPLEFFDESSEPNDTDPKAFKTFKTKAKSKPFPFSVMNDATVNGVTIRNKKARYLFRQFTLQSVASQSSQLYEAWELMTTLGVDNQLTNDLIAISDPSPQGTVYVRPKFLKYCMSSSLLPSGNYIDGFYRAVPAIQWNAYTLAAEGGEVIMANANFAIQKELILAEQTALAANQDVAKKEFANTLFQGNFYNNDPRGILAKTASAAAGAGSNAGTVGHNLYGAPSTVSVPDSFGGKGMTANLPASVTGRKVTGVTGGSELLSAGVRAINQALQNGMDSSQFNEMYGRDGSGGIMYDQLQANQGSDNASLKARAQSLRLSQMSAYKEPPTFTSEAPVGVSSAFLTRFQVTVKDLDPQDLMLLDLQLSKDGYQVNENYNPTDTTAFTKTFNSRAKYNYVSFDEVDITTPYNGDISANVNTRLLSGIRVWHDKKSLGAYYQANPAN